MSCSPRRLRNVGSPRARKDVPRWILLVKGRREGLRSRSGVFNQAHFAAHRPIGDEFCTPLARPLLRVRGSAYSCAAAVRALLSITFALRSHPCFSWRIWNLALKAAKMEYDCPYHCDISLMNWRCANERHGCALCCIATVLRFVRVP